MYYWGYEFCASIENISLKQLSVKTVIYSKCPENIPNYFNILPLAEEELSYRCFFYYILTDTLPHLVCTNCIFGQFNSYVVIGLFRVKNQIHKSFCWIKMLPKRHHVTIQDTAIRPCTVNIYFTTSTIQK